MPVASHAQGLNGSASSSSVSFQDNYHDGGGPSRASSRQSIVTSPTPIQNNPAPNRRTNLPSPLSQMTGAEGSDRDDVETHPAPLHPPSAKKNVRISPELDPDSPCYIHSGLDNHGSLSGWLRNKHEHLVGRNLHHKRASAGAEDNEDREPVTFRKPASTTKQHKQKRRPGAPKPLTPAHPELVQPRIPSPPTDGGYESESSIMSRLDGSAVFDDAYAEYEDDDDETRASSLSRRLAETAQGVREVSKELSRTRVHSRIQSVLIVTKARDNRLITLTRELALYCMLRMPGPPPSAASSTADIRCSRNASPDRGMIVYVDDQLRHSKRFDAAGLQRDYPHLFEPITTRRRSSSTSASTTSISTMASSYTSSGGNGNGNGNGSGSGDKRSQEGQLRYWTPDMCSNSPQLFDFVVTLGGDGTVLFTSWLFQRIVPPVLPFALGSLGFLTNFDFKDYRKTIDRCVDEGIRVNLRMRFTCTVYRAVAPDASMVVGKGRKRKAIRRPGGEILVQQVDRDGWEALEGGAPIGDAPIGDSVGPDDREIMCFTTRPVEQFEVLNDLVVDRGPSPFVSLLEVFGEDHHLTTVQADGLTVSTPTGSTAYSLSAGGSLVHPGIPAILLTPICPHTLSFRPMLLPDGMELRVCVPYNSRSTAWASFDGRGRIELKQGDHIKITASKYPFPTVCAERQSTDWFKSIQRTLKWNERERQKSFVVVEDDDYDRAHKANLQEEDEYFGSESDSEDEFDIDDRSGGELTPPQPNDAHDTMLPPLRVGNKLRHLKELKDEYRSGVQSPDRFASSYEGPPPLSQRHLLEALAQVENKLRRVEIDTAEAQSDDIQGGDDLLEAAGVSIQRETVDGPATQTEAEEVRDGVAPLPIPIPDVDIVTRTESETTLGPDYFSRAGSRHLSDSDTNTLTGTRTPRQSRSRSRSRVREGSRSHSRSGSPHIGGAGASGTRKQKAFAFFGQDDSQSELSEGE